MARSSFARSAAWIAAFAWLPEWGWLWTRTDAFPYVYRSGTDGQEPGWLYFREGSSDPISFYDYAEEKWVTLGG